MSTVNFSVPDAVKKAFNEAYKGQNKSAVIAELMVEAVERAARKQRSHDAILKILERRQHAPALNEEEIRSARNEGRP